MKTSRAELKMRARRVLPGNYSAMILAALIIMGVSWAVSTVSQIGLVSGGSISAVINGGTFSWNVPVYMGVIVFLLALLQGIISILFLAGMINMSLCLCRDGSVELSQLFYGFKNHPIRLLLPYLLLYLLLLIAMVPLVVLGVVEVSLSATIGAGEEAFILLFLSIYVVILVVLAVLIELNFGMVYYVMLDNPEMGVFRALSETYRMMKGNRIRYLVLELSFIGWSFMGILSAGIGTLWINAYSRCTYAMFYLDIRPRADMGHQVNMQPQTDTQPWMDMQSQTDTQSQTDVRLLTDTKPQSEIFE